VGLSKNQRFLRGEHLRNTALLQVKNQMSFCSDWIASVACSMQAQLQHLRLFLSAKPTPALRRSLHRPPMLLAQTHLHFLQQAVQRQLRLCSATQLVQCQHNLRSHQPWQMAEFWQGMFRKVNALLTQSWRSCSSVRASPPIREQEAVRLVQRQVHRRKGLALEVLQMAVAAIAPPILRTAATAILPVKIRTVIKEMMTLKGFSMA
jgi:hypothetical protein